MRTRDVVVALACALVAATATITAGAEVGVGSTAKPVIGPPVSVPAKPTAGKALVVTFRVTSHGIPIARGVARSLVSVAGSAVPHRDAFAAGKARVSLVVPSDAVGAIMRIRLTVRTAAGNATRTASMRIGGAATPSASIGDATVAEGTGGSTTLTFLVRLTSAPTKTVSVGYATADGSAGAPGDYTSTSGTLTFAPGERAKPITVPVVADGAIEGAETLTMTLSAPNGVTIARGTATGTITNDDTSVPVSAGDYQGATQTGDYVYFTVTPDRYVTIFRINSLPETCTPYGRITGSVYWKTSRFLIQPDGTFHAVLSWSGSDKDGDVEWTAESSDITGTFDGQTARGTVLLKDELNYKGDHIACSSGTVTWTATKR